MFNQNGGYSLSDIAAATNGGNGNGFGDWGNGGWWIILLFLFAGGWNNWGGNGSGGANMQYGFDLNGINNGIRDLQSSISDGFYSTGTNALTQTSAIQNAMCNGFNGVNMSIGNLGTNMQAALYQSTIDGMQNTNAITQAINGLATQSASEHCSLQTQLAANQAQSMYSLAEQECNTRRTVTDSVRDLIDNQNANTRSILEFLTNDKLAALTAENQSLKFAASQQEQNNYLLSQLLPVSRPAYITPNPYTGVYGNGLYGNGFASGFNAGLSY